MVELLTRPSPLFAAVSSNPRERLRGSKAEFVIDDAPHCPLVIPRLPPTVGKLQTVLYQPFTATFLAQARRRETSRYRYTRVYQIRGAVYLPAASARREFKTFPYLRIWTVLNIRGFGHLSLPFREIAWNLKYLNNLGTYLLENHRYFWKYGILNTRFLKERIRCKKHQFFLFTNLFYFSLSKNI